MHFAVELPVDGVNPQFLRQSALAEMARTVESNGFHGCSVTDHPCPPGRWIDAGGHPAQDPFVVLSMVAAVTQRVRLLTALLVLPYRNPFVTARAAASLDVFSNGRVTLGVGAGYLKGEFAALGIDFDQRNELTDEAIKAMQAAWANDEFAFAGAHFKALGNRILPRPLQQPHPPLWVGGNSRRALRRAAELGNGWMPFAASASLAKAARTARLEGAADLRTGLTYLKEHAAAIGRTTPLDIAVAPTSDPIERSAGSAIADAVGVLQELGVTWCMLRLQAHTRRQWLSDVEWLAGLLELNH